MSNPTVKTDPFMDKMAGLLLGIEVVPQKEQSRMVARAVREMHKYHQAAMTEMQQWVNDLQSGMFINCVYCGHRYGPQKDTPVSMAEVLKEHIECCPKHPMSELKAENQRLREMLEAWAGWYNDLSPSTKAIIIDRGSPLPKEALKGGAE